MFFKSNTFSSLSNGANIVTKLSRLLSDDFQMFSGNDDIIVPMMSIGASGVISVLANIAPKQTAKICSLCEDGNYKEANKLANDLLPLTNDLFIEVNPIPVKEAMNYLGFNVGGYRAPLDYMDKAKLEVLKKEIDDSKEIIF